MCSYKHFNHLSPIFVWNFWIHYCVHNSMSLGPATCQRGMKPNSWLSASVKCIPIHLHIYLSLQAPLSTSSIQWLSFCSFQRAVYMFSIHTVSNLNYHEELGWWHHALLLKAQKGTRASKWSVYKNKEKVTAFNHTAQRPHLKDMSTVLLHTL